MEEITVWKNGQTWATFVTGSVPTLMTAGVYSLISPSRNFLSTTLARSSSTAAFEGADTKILGLWEIPKAWGFLKLLKISPTVDVVDNFSTRELKYRWYNIKLITFNIPQMVWVFPVPGGPWTKVKGHESPNSPPFEISGGLFKSSSWSVFLFFPLEFSEATWAAAHLMADNWGPLKEDLKWERKTGVNWESILAGGSDSKGGKWSGVGFSITWSIFLSKVPIL